MHRTASYVQPREHVVLDDDEARARDLLQLYYRHYWVLLGRRFSVCQSMLNGGSDTPQTHQYTYAAATAAGGRDRTGPGRPCYVIGDDDDDGGGTSTVRAGYNQRASPDGVVSLN